MTSSIEIEDKDVTEEVEILAKPTKDDGSSVELDPSSLESIIHSLFELPQEARHLFVDVLQEWDDKDSISEEPIPKNLLSQSGDFKVSLLKAFLALIKNQSFLLPLST
ncbi:hypothetical protein ACH5RR_013292 [Cinchona calisaya]|uniref:Uncharacterized protein n=1 Tax=Cinchona calisaya TaxID=153742 RepID=A0ABD3A2X5_9GENT